MTIFDETELVTLIHGDATQLAEFIEPESVDLIVTSPPYFALRSYEDGGEHYDGQIGDEETPQQFLQALWKVAEQCWHVLKPTGSMFVNLGDKYSTANGNNADTRAKSLMGLPWRYAIGLIDDNEFGGGQWILRSEIIWAKPNGMPESVRDRVARKHEQWFHFVKNENYFAAIDEIRERHQTIENENVLGKLPGSWWPIATQPLIVPDEIGVDHYAAFPMEFPYRMIKCWTPNGYCQQCGVARTPKIHRVTTGKDNNPLTEIRVSRMSKEWAKMRAENPLKFIGYQCECSDTKAPTTPAVVLDPFGGTGTVAAVAKQLGRKSIHVDLSADYLRLAKWRIHESEHAEKWIENHHKNETQLVKQPIKRHGIEWTEPTLFGE
jgi:DNA modification methylase